MPTVSARPALYPPLPGQLGFRDYGRFISDLSKAINDEATAINFYRGLLGSAENEVQRSYIDHAYKDEQRHLKMFTFLYTKLTGNEPVISRERVSYGTYLAGIEKALDAELKASELYRNMFLAVRLPKVRDMLFRAMTDEMEHADRFMIIYTQLKAR